MEYSDDTKAHIFSLVRNGSINLDSIVERLLSVGYIGDDDLPTWTRPTFNSINTDEFKQLIALLYPWYDKDQLRIMSVGEFNGDECYALCNTVVVDAAKAQGLVTQTLARRVSAATEVPTPKS